jgi:hypothetical protein
MLQSYNNVFIVTIARVRTENDTPDKHFFACDAVEHDYTGFAFPLAQILATAPSTLRAGVGFNGGLPYISNFYNTSISLTACN